MKPKFFSAVIVLLGLLSFSIKGQDQPTGQKPKPLEPSSLQQLEPAASASVRSAAEKYFSDVELINQDGQTMRFYSDVLKDRVGFARKLVIHALLCATSVFSVPPWLRIA